MLDVDDGTRRKSGFWFDEQTCFVIEDKSWQSCGIAVSYKWEFPLFPIGGDAMALAVKTYDAKIDSKKHITLRSAWYEYYHVEEYDDGRIILEPRELVPPFQIFEKSWAMMDLSMENLKQGKVSSAIDLSGFEE